MDLERLVLRMILVILHLLGLRIWQELAPEHMTIKGLRKVEEDAQLSKLSKPLRGWGFGVYLSALVQRKQKHPHLYPARIGKSRLVSGSFNLNLGPDNLEVLA